MFFTYIYSGLRPNGTVPVIRYPMHRNHKINSIRAKMQNDNEIDKCTICDLNDLVHMEMHSMR